MESNKELQKLVNNPSRKELDSIESFLHMKYGQYRLPAIEDICPPVDKLNLKETRPLFYDAKMKIKGDRNSAKLVIANPIKRVIATIVNPFI